MQPLTKGEDSTHNYTQTATNKILFWKFLGLEAQDIVGIEYIGYQWTSLHQCFLENDKN